MMTDCDHTDTLVCISTSFSSFGRSQESLIHQHNSCSVIDTNLLNEAVKPSHAFQGPPHKKLHTCLTPFIFLSDFCGQLPCSGRLLCSLSAPSYSQRALVLGAD